MLSAKLLTPCILLVTFSVATSKTMKYYSRNDLYSDYSGETEDGGSANILRRENVDLIREDLSAFGSNAQNLAFDIFEQLMKIFNHPHHVSSIKHKPITSKVEEINLTEFENSKEKNNNLTETVANKLTKNHEGGRMNFINDFRVDQKIPDTTNMIQTHNNMKKRSLKEDIIQPLEDLVASEDINHDKLENNKDNHENNIRGGDNEENIYKHNQGDQLNNNYLITNTSQEMTNSSYEASDNIAENNLKRSDIKISPNWFHTILMAANSENNRQSKQKLKEVIKTRIPSPDVSPYHPNIHNDSRVQSQLVTKDSVFPLNNAISVKQMINQTLVSLNKLYKVAPRADLISRNISQPFFQKDPEKYIKEANMSIEDIEGKTSNPSNVQVNDKMTQKFINLLFEYAGNANNTNRSLDELTIRFLEDANVKFNGIFTFGSAEDTVQNTEIYSVIYATLENLRKHVWEKNHFMQNQHSIRKRNASIHRRTVENRNNTSYNNLARNHETTTKQPNDIGDVAFEADLTTHVSGSKSKTVPTESVLENNSVTHKNYTNSVTEKKKELKTRLNVAQKQCKQDKDIETFDNSAFGSDIEKLQNVVSILKRGEDLLERADHSITLNNSQDARKLAETLAMLLNQSSISGNDTDITILNKKYPLDESDYMKQLLKNAQTALRKIRIILEKENFKMDNIRPELIDLNIEINKLRSLLEIILYRSNQANNLNTVIQHSTDHSGPQNTSEQMLAFKNSEIKDEFNSSTLLKTSENTPNSMKNETAVILDNPLYHTDSHFSRASATQTDRRLKLFDKEAKSTEEIDVDKQEKKFVQSLRQIQQTIEELLENEKANNMIQTNAQNNQRSPGNNSGPESKSENDIISDELRKLKTAIDKLKPKEGTTIQNGIDNNTPGTNGFDTSLKGNEFNSQNSHVLNRNTPRFQFRDCRIFDGLPVEKRDNNIYKYGISDHSNSNGVLCALDLHLPNKLVVYPPPRQIGRDSFSNDVLRTNAPSLHSTYQQNSIENISPLAFDNNENNMQQIRETNLAKHATRYYTQAPYPEVAPDHAIRFNANPQTFPPSSTLNMYLKHRPGQYPTRSSTVGDNGELLSILFPSRPVAYNSRSRFTDDNSVPAYSPAHMNVFNKTLYNSKYMKKGELIHKINSLKQEALSLQNLVNSFNTLEYNTTTFNDLQNEIKNLNNMINRIMITSYSDSQKEQWQDGYNEPNTESITLLQQQNRQVPEIPNGSALTDTALMSDYMLSRQKRDAYGMKNPDYKVNYDPQVVQEVDTKNNIPAKSVPDALQDVKTRIENLKDQLDPIVNQFPAMDTTGRSAATQYGSDLYQYPLNYPEPYPLLPSYQIGSKSATYNKNDWFIDIVSKVMDKVLAALPVIFRKLFEFFLGQIIDVDYKYINSYGYGSNNIQDVFNKGGILGLIPIVIVRLLHFVNVFFSILRRNKFLRDFLVPMFIIGIVVGSVMFLIWWLQTNEDVAYAGIAGNYGYASEPVAEVNSNSGDSYYPQAGAKQYTRMNAARSNLERNDVLLENSLATNTSFISE